MVMSIFSIINNFNLSLLKIIISLCNYFFYNYTSRITNNNAWSLLKNNSCDFCLDAWLYLQGQVCLYLYICFIIIQVIQLSMNKIYEPDLLSLFQSLGPSYNVYMQNHNINQHTIRKGLRYICFSLKIIMSWERHLVYLLEIYAKGVQLIGFLFLKKS